MTEHGAFTWTPLTLPASVTRDGAQAALQALAGLSGQPRIVLEAEGGSGLVSWRLGADRASAPRVLAALSVPIPNLRAVHTTPAEAVTMNQAVGVYLPGHRQRPMQSNNTEPVARAVLGALSQARGHERVRLQLILGPRYRPRRLTNVEPDIRRDVLSKFAQYRFGCSLRIAASAATPERTRRLIDGVAAALRGLEAPGARLVVRRASVGAVSSARSPFFWPLELSIDELVPMLGWPVASRPDADLPGMASRHPVQLSAPAVVPRTGLRLGVSPLDTARPIAIKPADLLRHLHLLGPTGVGKSTVMGNLALQVIKAGHGAVVIDPKGDLVTDLLGRIPESRRDDVVVIDPMDIAPVGLAALAPQGDVSPDLLADTVLGVIHSLHAKVLGTANTRHLARQPVDIGTTRRCLARHGAAAVDEPRFPPFCDAVSRQSRPARPWLLLGLVRRPQRRRTRARHRAADEQATSHLASPWHARRPRTASAALRAERRFRSHRLRHGTHRAGLAEQGDARVGGGATTRIAGCRTALASRPRSHKGRPKPT